MRVFPFIAAIAALTASAFAQENDYSDVATVTEFITRINIGPVVETEVRTLLNASYPRSAGAEVDKTVKARLACDVSRAIFGSKLFLPRSATYFNLTDDNW